MTRIFVITLVAIVLIFGWAGTVFAQTADQTALIAQLQEQVQRRPDFYHNRPPPLNYFKCRYDLGI